MSGALRELARSPFLGRSPFHRAVRRAKALQHATDKRGQEFCYDDTVGAWPHVACDGSSPTSSRPPGRGEEGGGGAEDKQAASPSMPPGKHGQAQVLPASSQQPQKQPEAQRQHGVSQQPQIQPEAQRQQVINKARAENNLPPVGPPQAVPAGPLDHPVARGVLKAAGQAIDRLKMPAEQANKYKDSLTKALSKMSPGMLEKLGGGLKGLMFHASPENLHKEYATMVSAVAAKEVTADMYKKTNEMRKQVVARYGEGPEAKQYDATIAEQVKKTVGEITKEVYDSALKERPLGFYQFSTGNVSLDGGGGIYDEKDQVGTYAHELTHAIDCWGVKDRKSNPISSTKEWQEAFAVEIKGGYGKKYIGTYGQMNTLEGFAEFGRFLLHHHDPASPKNDNTLKGIETAFPKCVAVWRKHNLWPGK